MCKYVNIVFQNFYCYSTKVIHKILLKCNNKLVHMKLEHDRRISEFVYKVEILNIFFSCKQFAFLKKKRNKNNLRTWNWDTIIKFFNLFIK